MRMKALAVAASLALAAGSAGAATISNVDGPSLPFSGFDWAQGGTAYTTGFTPSVTPSTFSLHYFAVATALTCSGVNYNPHGAGHDSEWCPGPVLPDRSKHRGQVRLYDRGDAQ